MVVAGSLFFGQRCPFPWGCSQLLEAVHIPFHVDGRSTFKANNRDYPSCWIPVTLWVSLQEGESSHLISFPSLKTKLVYVFTEALNILKYVVSAVNRETPTTDFTYFTAWLKIRPIPTSPARPSSYPCSPPASVWPSPIFAPLQEGQGPARVKPLPLLPGPSPSAWVALCSPSRTHPASRLGATGAIRRGGLRS